MLLEVLPHARFACALVRVRPQRA
jgi:hypothetical protein